MLDYVKRLSPQYTTVGATTFAFSFRIFAATDVYVKIAASSTAGTSTTLTKDTDYTVSVDLDTQETTPGGTITLIGAYAGGLTSGQVLVIGSQVPWTQTMQLTNYSRFPPSIINTSEDRIVAQIQQLVESQGRTVTVDETDSRTPATVLADVFTARDTAVTKATEASNSATTASTKATEVTNKYNLISPYFTQIQAIYDDRTNVDTVAGSISNVNAVGTNISAVVGVNNNATNINAVNSNKTNIDTVAGISTDVTTVAGISSDVSAVADNETNVNTVSTNISNVNSVGGSISNVNTVASNIANITAVKNDLTNIDSVAGDLTNIDAASGHAQTASTKATEAATSATNASTYAAQAKIYAIGDPSEPTGAHSAKYYSEHMALAYKGEYSSTTTYGMNAFVKSVSGSTNSYYISLVDSNLGNPLTDTTKWELLFTVDAGVLGVYEQNETAAASATPQSYTLQAFSKLLVYVDGVMATQGTSYTITNTTVTFTSVIPEGTEIKFIRFTGANSGTLSVASTTELGVIKVGSNLAIDAAGSLSADYALATDAQIDAISV